MYCSLDFLVVILLSVGKEGNIMKKLFLLMMSCLTLCGCSPTANQTHGVIDCLEITIASIGVPFEYKVSTSPVYEYADATGKTLYLDFKSTSSSVHVFADHLKDDFIEYRFNKIVGYLAMESNYYLDIDKRIIDSETKYSECKLDLKDLSNDNSEAYRCAKRGYYTSVISTNSGAAHYYALYLNLADSSLERHSYIVLGNDTLFTYTPRI